MEMTTETAAKPKRSPKPKLVQVRLLKNYRPKGEFEVMEREFEDDPHSKLVARKPIGRPDSWQKNKETGEEVIALHANGEFAKVGVIAYIDEPGENEKDSNGKKLPAVRVHREIRLPMDEAQYCLRNKIAERADDLTAV